MLRSILVLLDETPGAMAAGQEAAAMARQCGAVLTAAVVLDRPHNAPEHEAVPLGGDAFRAHRDATLGARLKADVKAALDAFQSAAQGLSVEVKQLEDAPEAALLKAGAAHDLVVIGRDSTPGGEAADGGVAPVIEALLRDRAAPLLVIPPGPLPRSGPVLVAFDGTAPARHAVELYAASGLAPEAPVMVVSLGEEHAAAEALAEQARPLLPGREVTLLPLVGDDAAGTIPQEARRLGIRLLVMGAFGSGGLARLLLGSTTHRLLRDSPAPIFVTG